MKIQQLRTFVSVAEHRSIRGAARALNVSQPAVTRTMRELEADLDTQLLRRSVEGVELTQAGQALQVRARLLMEDIRRAREELLYMKEGRHGQVSAAVTSTIGLTLLPDVLSDFVTRMPQAQINLSEEAPPAAFERLRSGALDFVVTNTPDGELPEDMQHQPLFTMQFMAVARTAHPCIKARTLKALQDERWIVPSLNRRFFARWFEAHGLKVPGAVLGCETFGIAVNLASRMDLLLLASTSAYEVELRPRGLHPLKLRDPIPPVGVSIVTLQSAHLTPAARCLVDCLQRAPLPRGLSRVEGV